MALFKKKITTQELASFMVETSLTLIDKTNEAIRYKNYNYSKQRLDIICAMYGIGDMKGISIVGYGCSRDIAASAASQATNTLYGILTQGMDYDEIKSLSDKVSADLDDKIYIEGKQVVPRCFHSLILSTFDEMPCFTINETIEVLKKIYKAFLVTVDEKFENKKFVE